jgi:hypothetical protein
MGSSSVQRFVCKLYIIYIAFFRYLRLRKNLYYITLDLLQITGWCAMAVYLSRGDTISFESHKRQIPKSNNLHN